MKNKSGFRREILVGLVSGVISALLVVFVNRQTANKDVYAEESRKWESVNSEKVEPNPEYQTKGDKSSGHIILDPGTGNVGIGTTSPTAKLHVAGTVRITDSLLAGVWQKIHEATLTNATTHTVSGLNGDNDKFYMIVLEGVYNPNAQNRTIGVRPQGDEVAANYRILEHFSGRSGGASHHGIGSALTPSNLLPLGRNSWSSNNCEMFIFAIMNARTGRYRNLNSDWVYSVPGVDEIVGGYMIGSWRDSTTNITSLVFHFSVATGGTGFTGRLVIFALRDP